MEKNEALDKLVMNAAIKAVQGGMRWGFWLGSAATATMILGPIVYRGGYPIVGVLVTAVGVVIAWRTIAMATKQVA